MKKYYIAICFNFFIIFTVFSQNHILTGFLDISWETSREEAIKHMENRNFTRIQDTNNNTLNYRGTFAGKNNAEISLEFVDNKFWQAKVIYTDNDFSKMLLLHFELETMLVERYGNPTNKNNAPGIGENSMWVFSNNCGLSIAVTRRSPRVTIIYINLSYRQLAEEQERKSAMSDL